MGEEDARLRAINKELNEVAEPLPPSPGHTLWAATKTGAANATNHTAAYAWTSLE